jgi:two-component system, NarL family, nitrate/nitrite response regulator NarL
LTTVLAPATIGAIMAHDLNGFTLLLVDDHPLFREGMALAITAREPGLEVIPVATADAALSLLATDAERFDLVVIDHGLPGGVNGLEWARRLRTRFPSLPCALISGDEHNGLANEAQRAGLSAFLPKSLDITILLETLGAIARGDTWFPTSTTPTYAGSALTSRQIEIVGLAARGASSKEIARTLSISPTTVRNHFGQIFERLGARNRAQAVALAQQSMAREERIGSDYGDGVLDASH